MIRNSAILVVDDTHANLELLTDILALEGYQVRPADGGELALASVSASPPELILLDINMPGMDGFEVLRRLKARDESRDIPVIILSAFTDVEKHVDGFNLGAVDYISKPFQREELLSRVRTHLGLSVLSRENARKGVELTKALDDLKKSQSLLVHQEKMASLGMLSAGIAHEINNPLAFVLGNEQVLKRDFDDLLSFINTLGDSLPKMAALAPCIYAEIITKAGAVDLEYLVEAVPRKITTNIEGLERVKQIILDLRNFSRLDEGVQKYCFMAEGIESTIRFLGPLQQEYGVTVETDFGNLPQLLCSPGPLNQAISDVLANAIQASQGGQTVRVSTHLDGDWYCVEVADQGTGISAEHLSKVFDPFFTTKPVGSGTGLGLSIAHQIVAAQDGRIEIDSLPGSGTTVRILLPKNSKAIRQIPVRTHPMALSKGFSIQTRLQSEPEFQTTHLPTLLVVDDEHEITASIADQFRRNYNVVTAASADAALEAMKQQDVSVILTDQRMPGKNGSELLAEACLIDTDVVRILMTGYADIEAVIKAVNEGQIFFYLTKPWRTSEMVAVVTKAMEHNLLLRDNRRLVEKLRRNNAELEERVKVRTMQLEQRALELEEANRKISELVYLDPLTGVANRRILDGTLAMEAERGARLGLPLTVAMLDVDHFKSVNDTFGHAIGDKVLQAIAQTVSGHARPYDLVVCFGGEEFLILMPGVTLHDGGLAAERFRFAIAEIAIEGISHRVTASFGVATLSPGQDPHSLFKRADSAMYRAKQNGRNRVELDNSNETEIKDN